MLIREEERPGRQQSAGSAAVLDAACGFAETLKAGCHVLVAVSGGSDSLGLLIALRLACERTGRPDIRISAATVDHGLRRESAREAVTVGHFCHSLGVAHTILAWTGEKPATGIMQAARDARYQLLADHAAAIDADVIAVGHTLDDQAETLVMRMRRSEDLAMSCMADHTLVMGRHWIARPLLRIRRGAIRSLLDEREIAWSDDPANDDARFERVRVRKALAQEDAVGALAARVDEGAAARARLAAAALIQFEGACRIHGRTVADIDVLALQDRPDASRYLMNTLIAVLGGRVHGPGSASLADVIRLVEGPSGERLTAGRCLFEKRNDRLYVLRERRGLPEIFVPAGAVSLWDGRWRVDNRSLEPAVVRPMDISGSDNVPHVFAGLPARIGQLAAAVQPSPSGQGALSAVGLSPAFAPFDRFLPGIDLNLANAIATRFGHPGYSLPARVYLR